MQRKLTTGISAWLLALIAGSLAGCATFPGLHGSFSPVKTAATAVVTEPDANPEAVADYRPEFNPHEVAQGALPNKQRAQEHGSPFPSQDAAASDTHNPGTATVPGVTENPFAAMARENLRPAAYAAAAAQPIEAFAAARARSASTFRAAEPRLPTPHPLSPVADDATISATQLAQVYPDEYIFDGGDRDHPVHYYGDEMEGLDTEDTVAEFRDHEGISHVRASNRVAVYAPKFGSVETVSGLKMDIKVDQAIGARNTSGVDTLNEDRGLVINVSEDGPVRVDSRRSASGVETAQEPARSKKVEGLVETWKIDQGLEARTSSGPGTLETSELHELTVQIREPITSNNSVRAQTKATTSQATLTYSTYRLAATVGREEGGRKGKLHLTKEATPLVAQQGDTITFTIRFQNVGDYNVNSVRIIDNLTPRLTYSDGTGHIDVDGGGGGGLTVVPNKEGSQTLIFELDEPLQGGTRGVITFDAVVR